MKNWKVWFKAAGVRAIRSFAGAALSLIPAAVSITEVDWFTVLGTATLAGVVSLLMALNGLPEIKENDE